MRTFRIIAGLVLDLLLFGLLVPGLTLLAGKKLDVAFFASRHLDHPLFTLAGVGLVGAGALWLLWAAWLLVTEGRGFLTELFGFRISPVPTLLVTRGPFAVHRHPLCVGYLIALAGLSLIAGSPGSLFVMTPGWFLLTPLYLRLFEEPGLKQRFGADYLLYAVRVPLFFPAGRRRIPVAFRNLQGDRLRFSVNVVGVSFAILLICFQLSVLKGTSNQITTYIDHIGADIWVLQQGVDDFIATSTLPRPALQELKKLEGVDRAVGILAVYTLLKINQVKSRVYIIGYDTGSGDGGPWKLGRTLPQLKNSRDLKDNKILLDQDLARRHRLEPGDRLALFGQTFTVAGFTLETTSIGSQYAFLSREAFGRLLPGGEFFFTHLLVWKSKGVSDGTLIRRIEAALPLTGLTRAQLADNMREFLGTFMLPLLLVGVLMGFLVGSITIGITLYTSILERFKEYGTMKALGATDRYLYGLLLRQALISLTVGTLIGLALSILANRIINQWVPGMTARLDGALVVQTLAAGLAMALFSTALPMWRLRRLDPMEAFRA
ncbi:MAG: FtsX-like permease family protein [Deltaproteobacteria bacterium]|nr:FtsX-like permease family protein [Deltaproteobacteria bacterium]